jgi:hypothetical protein
MNETLYTPIDVFSLRNGAIQSFDVFSRAEDEKMALFCASGKTVDEEIINKIQENNINILYIYKKDKNYYNLYLEEVLNSILSDPFRYYGVYF